MSGFGGRETVRNSGLRAMPSLMLQVKAYMVRSRAEHRLKQLDERLLSDAGITRRDIRKAVWG
jgi:uncharacterized protein YjiS (DUF1127 family)